MEPPQFAGVNFADARHIRTTNLLVTGFFSRYLAERKSSFAPRCWPPPTPCASRAEIGLGGSVGAIARLFHRVFRAAGACVVIAERKPAARLWQVDARPGRSRPGAA